MHPIKEFFCGVGLSCIIIGLILILDHICFNDELYLTAHIIWLALTGQ